jgi:hypothetical protein
VAAQGREHKTPTFNLVEQGISFCLALKKLLYVKVCRARIGTTADFNRLNALGNTGIEGVVQ